MASLLGSRSFARVLRVSPPGEPEGLQALRSQVEQANLHRSKRRSTGRSESGRVQQDGDLLPRLFCAESLLRKREHLPLLLLCGEYRWQWFNIRGIASEYADVVRKSLRGPRAQAGRLRLELAQNLGAG